MRKIQGKEDKKKNTELRDRMVNWTPKLPEEKKVTRRLVGGKWEGGGRVGVSEGETADKRRN